VDGGTLSLSGQREVRRVTWAGLAVNLILAALKLAAGWVGSSQAVIADAVHSLSDISTDVGVLVGLRYWSRPRDADHPYGHARIEHLVAVALGLVLAGTAVGIAYHAISTHAQQHAVRPAAVALGAAALSIAVKEGLYRWAARVARRVASPALLANAWHHRSDALSSLPALLSVAVAMLVPAWGFVDHIGAVVVAFFILQAAGKIAFPSLNKLVDTAPPAELREAILQAAQGVPGVEEAHAMRTRYLGSGVAVDLHVEVDPELSVREGHDIAERLAERLRADFERVEDVVVHVEPGRGAGPEATDPASGGHGDAAGNA
jgi:cation diffusion facilitator family transporter